MVAGEPVSFGTKFISSTINLAGNWGWPDLDGSGGATLRSSLATGATVAYSVGEDVGTSPGKKTGPVTQGLNDRFAGCPSIADPCNGSNPSGVNGIPAGDPCLVVVPVVDFALAAKNGQTSTPILAFAEIYLDPTTTTGTDINGCYVSAVVGSTQTGSTQSFGPTTPPTLVQ